jgi:hypothetical protein
MDLAKPSKDRQLLIGHAHVGFVHLDVRRGLRFQFSSRWRRQESGNEKVKRPHCWSIGREKASRANMTNRFKSVLEMDPIGFKSPLEQSYFVKYPRRLASSLLNDHIPFINVGTGQDEQRAVKPTRPWNQLRQKIGPNHATSRL